MGEISLWQKDEVHFSQPGCLLSPLALFIGWMNKLSLLKILYTLKCFKYISMRILRVSVCWFSVGWVTWSYLHCDITVPRAEARGGELSFRSWVIWNQCCPTARLHHRGKEHGSINRSEKKTLFLSQHYKSCLCQRRDTGECYVF